MAKKIGVGKAIGFVLLFLVIFAVLAVGVVSWWTWLAMLAFGISHSINASIPAIGFNATIPFGVLLALVAGSGSVSNKRK